MAKLKDEIMESANNSIYRVSEAKMSNLSRILLNLSLHSTSTTVHYLSRETMAPGELYSELLHLKLFNFGLPGTSMVIQHSNNLKIILCFICFNFVHVSKM